MIPKTIPENHRAAIRSVAVKFSVAESEIVRLYLAAAEILETGTTKAPNIMPSILTHNVMPPKCPGHRIDLISVTGMSGIYVQLAVEKQKACGPVLLTTGKKFSMEGTDSVSNSVSTMMF